MYVCMYVCMYHCYITIVQEMAMYVSNAKASYEAGPLNAYDRRFVKLDLKQLFSEPRPGTA